MRVSNFMMSLMLACTPLSALAQPTSATLLFTVDILAKQCTVEVGPGQAANGIINMGTFSNKTGSAGPTIPLAFRFKDCQSVSAVQSIEFTRDIGAQIGNNPGSDPGGPDQGFVSTNKKKVRIFLTEDDDGGTPFRRKQFSVPQAIDPNAWVPVCYAQARVVDVDQDGVAAQAGAFEGKAEFTVTYQ